MTHTATQITVTAPAKAAGSYAVVVTTPVGGTSTATHDFTYVAAPAITSLTPAKVKATATHAVKITGYQLHNSHIGDRGRDGRDDR